MPHLTYYKGGGHAVEIVDYGTTAPNVSFWVIKNSWGRRFGVNGYFRIRRGDLEIGTLSKYLAPITQNSANQTVSRMLPGLTSVTCSAESVEDPLNNVAVMSSVDAVIEELNNANTIPCPDRSSPSAITLQRVTNQWRRKMF